MRRRRRSRGSPAAGCARRFVIEDKRIDQIFNEVEERARIAPRVYPFVTEGDIIRRSDVVGSAAYLLLLWLCLPTTPFRLQSRWTQIEVDFDELCGRALVSFLGIGTEFHLFAARYADDDDEGDERPESFPKAIVWLRDKLRLQTTNKPPPTDAEDQDESLPPRTYNDGGVDVVAWRAFADDKPAFPVVLAQGTIQRKWRLKTRDVVPELWNGWLIFPTPFLRVLMIPFPASHRGTWFDRNRMAGLILDRMRIAELLDGLPDDQLAAVVRDEAIGWLDEDRLHYESEADGGGNDADVP